VPPSATWAEADAGRVALTAAVQHNCDLADALHARERSLCTYLLGMREYFRWASGLPLGAPPPRAQLSAWIGDRERHWERLRDAGATAFAPLPLDAGIDAFDIAGANRALRDRDLVYGAGVGLFGAPQFFLAQLHARQRREGASVLIAERELARGLIAAPAATRAGSIVVRRDALRRWLWTRIEAARRGPTDTAFLGALRAYGGADDPGPALERMADAESETLILHELGELRAGTLLGPDWETMLAAIDDRRTELLARAVRDLCADCLVTLPELLGRTNDASLLFWRSNFDGLQRALAPELASPFDAGSQRLDRAALERAATHGSRAWVEVAGDLLDSWRRGGQALLAEHAARLAPAG